MKSTRPITTIVARWLLILSLITVPSLAWGQKNKSAPAPKAAPAAHASAPASHAGGNTGGAKAGGGGATTANRGGGTTTANKGTTTANKGTTTTANKGTTTTANKGTTTTTANKGATTTTANALKIIGRAEYVVNGFPAQNAVNNPGAAGAIQIAVRKGVFMYAQDTSITAAAVGSPCFALDDNNVTATDRASGASVQQYAVAGEVVSIDTSGEVWVDFWHQSALAA